MTRTTAGLCAALIAIALVAVAGPASAHVTVSSTDAAKGGFGKAVFSVPTESDTAATTKLVVTLPKGTPLAFVSAGVKPGWKIKVGKVKLDKPTKVGDFTLTEAVRTITWTATGDGIPPGQFDEFALSGGPYPDVDSIAFAAAQTYSDGTVVSWSEVQKGDKEPEHPAPKLVLTDAAAPAAQAGATAKDDGGSGPATWLGGAAVVVAAAALVVALRQNRRRA